MIWTTSKVLAYLMFLAGVAAAVFFKSPDVLVQLSATSAIVIAVKTGADAYKNKGVE